MHVGRRVRVREARKQKRLDKHTTEISTLAGPEEVYSVAAVMYTSSGVCVDLLKIRGLAAALHVGLQRQFQPEEADPGEHAPAVDALGVLGWGASAYAP